MNALIHRDKRANLLTKGVSAVRTIAMPAWQQKKHLKTIGTYAKKIQGMSPKLVNARNAKMMAQKPLPLPAFRGHAPIAAPVRGVARKAAPTKAFDASNLRRLHAANVNPKAAIQTARTTGAPAGGTAKLLAQLNTTSFEKLTSDERLMAAFAIFARRG